MLADLLNILEDEVYLTKLLKSYSVSDIANTYETTTQDVLRACRKFNIKVSKDDYILTLLESLNPYTPVYKIKYQYNELNFDIYLPEYKIAIDIYGNFNTVYRDIIYTRPKYNTAKKYGIRLLSFVDDEWDAWDNGNFVHNIIINATHNTLEVELDADQYISFNRYADEYMFTNAGYIKGKRVTEKPMMYDIKGNPIVYDCGGFIYKKA